MNEFRKHPTAAALLGIGGLALCLVIAAVRLGWFRPAPSLPDDARVAATATISPRSHYFADIVTARLELLFRRDRVPPSSVRVTAPFTPYTVVSRSATRTDAGNTTHLLYRFRLWCVTFACLPRGERKLAPPRAVVTYTPAGGAPRTLYVVWPRTMVSSRRVLQLQGRPLLAAHVRPLPAVTYTVRPWVLAAVSLAGALLLLLLAVALLVPAIPRSLGIRLPAWLRRRPPRLTPLEQALARLRTTSANGNGDERRALEQLAVELAGSGESGLARDARRLAWSPGRPDGDGVAGLSADVERLIGASR